MGLDGGLTTVEGLVLEDTPRTAGWLLGTGFGCGRLLFEVFGGSLLLLDAIVASVKQEHYSSSACLKKQNNACSAANTTYKHSLDKKPSSYHH